MLAQLKKLEADKRHHDAEVARLIKEEADAIVKGLHDVIAPDVEELGAWPLPKHYGQERTLASVNYGWPKSFLNPQGLSLSLGSDAWGTLKLTVKPREPGGVFHIHIHRNHPFKGETIALYPGHTPAATVVEAFLKEALKYLPMEVKS